LITNLSATKMRKMAVKASCAWMILSVVPFYVSSQFATVYAQNTKQSQNNKMAVPAWIAEPQKDLSAPRYWVGLGQARSLAGAQDKARAEIAKIVQSNIKSQDQYNTVVEQNTNQNEGKERVATQAQQSVVVLTDVDLSHISIRQTYQDPKTGDYYALAVLDKQAAIDRFSDDLQQLQAGLNGYVQQAEQAQTDERLLVALVNWMRAKNNVQTQDKLKLRIRAMGGDVAKNEAISAEKITEQINMIRPKIKLAILVEGENSKRLARVAQSFVSSQGIKTVATNTAQATESEANAVLSIVLSWDETSQRANMVAQKAVLDVSLGTNEEEVSACHSDTRKVASRLSLVQADVLKTFEQQVNSFLTAVFFNQDMKGCL
jgi:hypothetical protein